MWVWDSYISWLCYNSFVFNLVGLFTFLCLARFRDVNAPSSELILFVYLIHSGIITLFKIKRLTRFSLKLITIMLILVFLGQESSVFTLLYQSAYT